MKYSVCLTTPEVRANIPLALLSGSFDQRLAKASAYGFKGVELMVAEPARLDIDSLRSDLVGLGLVVSAVSSGAIVRNSGLSLLSGDKTVRSKAEKCLHELIHLADRVAAPVVTLGSFRGRAASVGGIGVAASLLQEILTRAANLASGLGISLALEPLNRMESDFICNRAEATAFIVAVGHPNLGLLLDTYHVDLEEPDCIDSFAMAAADGLLQHVHISGRNRLPPGPGGLAFAGILDLLAKVNYTGFLSAELLAGDDPDGAARETMEFMESLDHSFQRL